MQRKRSLNKPARLALALLFAAAVIAAFMVLGVIFIFLLELFPEHLRIYISASPLFLFLTYAAYIGYGE